MKSITIAVAGMTLVAACAPVRPAGVVATEQAACYAQGPQSQACADYRQDQVAMDKNAQTAAVLVPLAVVGALGLAIAGVAAHPGGPHGPPGPPPHPLGPPHP